MEKSKEQKIHEAILTDKLLNRWCSEKYKAMSVFVPKAIMETKNGEIKRIYSVAQNDILKSIDDQIKFRTEQITNSFKTQTK